jgi:hypothetical protein
MRWIDPSPPQGGDKRERQWFALFPVLIVKSDISVEYRWLEKVRVEEEYIPEGRGQSSYWEKRRFLEPERKGNKE